MSREEQREDATLLREVAQRLNLYDNLFPEVESKELQVLFALIRIYLARCDNPQLKREHMMISPHLTNRLVLTYFDPFMTAISRGLREALISRLNSIRKYRVTNPEVVRRTLVTCLYSGEEKVYTRQKKYLDAFMKNPGKSLVEIAKKLGVTPQAVSIAYRSMKKSDLFSVYGYVNYPIFKLRHFVVFFTATREYRGNNEPLRRLFFDNLPFTLSLNVDVYEGSSWASLVIPDQNAELSEFKKSLNELKGEVFREIKTCELKSFSTGSNLEFFDGKRWFFDPQLWAYGFFEFVRENKELLRRATELRYATQPMRFERLDFLIASILFSNSWASHDEIRKQLGQLSYDVSRPTITRRVNRLILPRQPPNNGEEDGAVPAVYPYIAYWGLGLKNLSAYLIECDQERLEELYYAVGYLPYYFLYRTDNGVLLSIKSTVEDAAKIDYMMKGINEIRIANYSNRFQNIGTRPLTSLHGRWDETKQRWICANHELDFVKRYESLG